MCSVHCVVLKMENNISGNGSFPFFDYSSRMNLTNFALHKEIFINYWNISALSDKF